MAARTAFFKRLDTFATVGQAHVTDYSAPISSAGGNTGTITVVGELTQSHTRQWLLLGDNLYYITAVQPQNGLTTITVGDWLTAFSRPLVYSTPSVTYMGEFIASVMTSEYISLADTAYAMPYLSVSSADTTSFSYTPDSSGLYSLESAMRYAQSKGVQIDFSISGNTLTVTMSTASTSVVPIVVGGDAAQLAEESYARSSVAKVTIIDKNGAAHDYYLATDGTISTSAPINRADGEWVTVKDSGDVQTAAENAFAGNVASHKISFFAKEKYRLFQPVLLRLRGQVFATYITFVGINAKDTRYSYSCGELANTLSEKLGKVSNSYVPTSAASIFAPVQSVDGGTGNVDIWTQRYLGENPISSAAYDTVANWYAKGAGWAWYSQFGLNDQPGQWGFLFNIINGTQDVMQIFLASSTGELYRRSGYINAGWVSTWKRLVTENEICYKPGDSVSFTMGEPFAGYVTSSTTKFRFSVPVPKSMANIATITVTSMIGAGRAADGGYMDGGSADQNWRTNSAYTITAAKSTDALIYIEVTKTSAFTNASNNTPATFAATNLTLSFS